MPRVEMNEPTVPQSHSPAATALSLLGAAFIIGVGAGYVIAPEKMGPQFGLPDWPRGRAAGFGTVKGVRDVVTGLIVLALLATRQRRALGVATVTIALIPTGDMLTILLRRGSTATALGVHGLTASLVAATGALLLKEARSCD
ncbi:DUF4267 domain-containing protein [Nocardia acidivorans]|uniref:DUF4267 domain-containing protein n=1 Tax=Nocardia acidivorans TaxID=404580 RepID=UPI000AB9535F|nr:DUF4267 domain-containing protein [Nocardia acidivorans]